MKVSGCWLYLFFIPLFSCGSEEPFGQPEFICWIYSIDQEISHYPITIKVNGTPIGIISGTVGNNPDVFSLKSENIQRLTTDTRLIRAFFRKGSYTFSLEKSGNGGSGAWEPVLFPKNNNITLVVK